MTTPLRSSVAILLFALFVPSASAVDAGIYTIADGDVRVLRGTTWFRLVAGARVQQGDVVDATNEYAQVQLELAGGGTVNLQGPALAHAAEVLAADNRPGVAELVVQRGWLKAAAPVARPLRLRLLGTTLDVSDAIVVVHGTATLLEVFVEAGTVKVTLAVARGKAAPAHEVKAGEFVSRPGDRALAAQNRPPQAFVSGMPRQFRDALPVLAANFPEARELAAGREITLAEAEPWMSGASRRGFVRRFTPRLADPAFRAGVAARGAAFPEWDRILHPEKYRPKETGNVK